HCAMNRLLAPLLLVLPIAAHAQNWALLNPAYKYNYSNDGTDTISNQIRVMHIDTLGVDSFRYELNLVGVVCDTCPASLGGPCDGCFVRVNQPQFLGYECVRSGSEWTFMGPNQFLISPAASLGSSWIFDASHNILATMHSQWAAEVFGVPDTLRKVQLSNGDSILLSQSFGVLHFHYTGDIVDLIGVEGAGVGRLLPHVLDYFDFQPGDELIYRVASQGWCTPDGGPQYPTIKRRNWRIIITGRNEVTDGHIYTTSTALSPYTGCGTVVYSPNWQLPTNQWSFIRSDLLAKHPMLDAYPGQVLDTSICDNFYTGSTLYLAVHGIGSDGRSTMRSRVLRNIAGLPTGGIDGSNAAEPGLYPFKQEGWVNMWYEEGLGLRFIEHTSSNIEGLSVELIGAVIAGDTVIPPPAINWTVGIQEHAGSEFSVFPNPASDAITLIGTKGGESLLIHDLEGRLVRTARINRPNEVIDVRSIRTGMYLFSVDGAAPKRLMIAR
ncbi:MAG TPA: T9SS type A sorting domain-containing protein, partial [Flavobacteriales bacterium]|nr:T9SS type A sorting domain-containing protein [Flavobacteriales bacterium]